MIIAAALIIWAAITLLYLFVRQQRELTKLRDALRVFSREGTGPKRLRFESRIISSIWRAILAQPVRARTLSASSEAFTDALSLSTELASAASEMHQAAEAVGDLLRTKVGPDVIAVSVIVREAKGSEAKVVYNSGIPLSRIKSSLLMSFDSVVDANSESAWGYQDASNGALNNFSVFGVSRSLIVPLRRQGEICGAIWLGLRAGSLGLTPDRRRFLLAITEHAAASFYAAQQAEARSEESRRERDFLLGMSHDLRAPSNRALLAVRDMLEEGDGSSLTSSRHERLGEVEESILEQLQLLGDVLEFAKSKKGFLRADKKVFDISAVMKSVVSRHKADAERKGIKFQLGEMERVGVNADPLQIKRIIDNLVLNAIKYSDDGVIELRLVQAEGKVEILVLDQGRGVASEDRSSLFDEFSVGHEGKVNGGVGLGLALSRALAELNGAYVFYRPRKLCGSIFGLCLPSISGKELSEFDQRRVSGGACQSFRHALVADDHAASCRMSVRYLNDLVLSSTPASSIKELLSLAKRIRPDLLITDWHFADGSFDEIIKELPPLRKLVIVSGRAMIPKLPDGLPIDSVTILQKPLVREQLIECLSAWDDAVVDGVMNEPPNLEQKVA
jgi:signal transduction histidine kinase/ActR/RegA family two-component response regulator